MSKLQEFELLQQMNTVLNSTVIDLQAKNQSLQEQIKHLEQLLFHKDDVHILNHDKDQLQNKHTGSLAEPFFNEAATKVLEKHRKIFEKLAMSEIQDSDK